MPPVPVPLQGTSYKQNPAQEAKLHDEHGRLNIYKQLRAEHLVRQGTKLEVAAPEGKGQRKRNGDGMKVA